MGVVSRLRASLHQVQNYLSGRGVKSTIELINFNGRSLAKAVLGYSTLHQADLIMIMTQHNFFGLPNIMRYSLILHQNSFCFSLSEFSSNIFQF